MKESQAAQNRRGGFDVPLLALGFRPFYLAAALFGVIAVPLWIASYLGVVSGQAYLAGMIWHSHEMVFGFAAAVIAGFLLTAVRNWTGQATPTGTGLALLLMIWLAGRVSVVTGPAFAAVLLDTLFLPLLALVLAIPICRSRNMRNYKLLVVLTGLTICNVLFHLAHLGMIRADWLRVSITLSLDVITILMVIVGGRVIPAFLANAVADASPRHVFAVEILAIGTLLAILLFDVLGDLIALPKLAWLALLITAALANAIRWLFWQPVKTRGNALLWMLPVAYVWIPVSLALRAFATGGLVPAAAPVHALTIGAMSGLMLAMMARSALGHTGRELKAGAYEISAFVLVQLAAVVRVAGTVIDSGVYRSTIILSAALWLLAFLLFLVRYVPILMQARIDGRPG